MNLGRNQLLGWINQVLQCEYANIQMLADGVGYCQLLDAIHPGSINITRINLCTRYPDDCLRNLRILQSCLKKLKITQPVSFQKISQGKFQDNIIFLQWIYTYTMRNGIQNLSLYDPFNRRLQILQKQGKSIQDINRYLVPTQAYYNKNRKSSYQYQQQQQQQQQYDYDYDQKQHYQQNQHQQQQQNEQVIALQKKTQIKQRLHTIKQDTLSLQGQLKTQMQTNWKLMHNIERSIQDRNTLYSLLKQIQTIVKQSENTSIGTGILSLITEIQEDFM